MKRPTPTQHDAAKRAAALIHRSQSGSRQAVLVHVKRAEIIGETIWRRWQVMPVAWQAKHLRWLLSHHTRDLKPSTRYDWWRTVRVLCAALGKFEDWKPHLKGPWQRPDGEVRAPAQATGRPTKLLPQNY